jgi:hypothetical protein
LPEIQEYMKMMKDSSKMRSGSSLWTRRKPLFEKNR